MKDCGLLIRFFFAHVKCIFSALITHEHGAVVCLGLAFFSAPITSVQSAFNVHLHRFQFQACVRACRCKSLIALSYQGEIKFRNQIDNTKTMISMSRR